ncbi:hypothetical protein BGZ46_006915 [Entomortierella lignicola]|nr:hypothetical protein BGZ46_006915 [Entomortierella lignicola]
MFTSHGYQPSIFMDGCPKKHTNASERRIRSHSQVTTEYGHRVNVCCIDYIQIRLNSRPPSPLLGPTTANSAPSLALVPNALHGTIGSPLYVETSSDDDELMEWESCMSSPLAQTVPDTDRRSVSPPFGPGQINDFPNSPALSLAETKAPVALAFQKYAMLPHLPFRGRCQSIFLAAETSSNSRMHRRLKDLLHNTSVERIRAWFKSTIECCALEQWRNMSLLDHFTKTVTAPRTSDHDSIDCHISSSCDDCPICFRSNTIMKVIATCGHMICWKCEQDLDRAGNIACPMCRRMRLASTYKNVGDMFRTTIGLHPRDYIHEYCIPISPSACCLQVSSGNNHSDEDDQEEVEHELTDRYLWEQSASFLEYLQLVENCPTKQYFQLNAVQDLCFKPSTEQNLPEYNDQNILEPPTSGLVLPAHRLYIALVHFCIDMLTLPRLTDFQLQLQFKREAMLLELVTLFLVPTDEFSPRGEGRIYNAPAWIEHGQHILARIYRFIQSRAHRSMREFVDEEPSGTDQSTRMVNAAVPSAPIPRHILYLGTRRWTWIAQSLSVLLTWIQAAHSNPSMVSPVTNRSGLPSLGKRSLLAEGNPRPVKRRRLGRRTATHSS